MAIDEKALETAHAASRSHIRGSYASTRAAILAYEAAKPAPAGAVAWVQPGYLANLQRSGSFPMRGAPDPETGYTIPLYAHPAPASAAEAVGMSQEMTDAMMDAGQRYLDEKSLNGRHVLPGCFNWHEFWRAILSTAPAPAGEEA